MGGTLGGKLRQIVCAIVCFSFVSGCTVFQPYPDFPPPRTDKADLTTVDPLDHAFAELYSARGDLVYRINEITYLQGAATIATYAGAMTAVGFGMFGGSADAIKGALLGTGGALVGGRLFASPDYRQTYMDGLTGLECIEGAALPASAAIDKIKQPAATLQRDLDSLKALLDQTRGGRPGTDISNAIAQADATYTAGEAAYGAANALIRAGIQLGASMSTAIGIVMQDVRQRINGQLVSPSDALRMVQSIGQLGLSQLADTQSALANAQASLRNQRAPALTTNQPVKEGTAPPDPIIDQLAQASVRIKNAIALVPTSLDVASSTIQTAVAACKLPDATQTTISKNPAGDVQLKIGGPAYTYSINGGKGPFTQRILGTAVDNVDVPAASINGAFTIAAKVGATDGQSFTIEVTDGFSTPSARLTFKVTLKK